MADEPPTQIDDLEIAVLLLDDPNEGCRQLLKAYGRKVLWLLGDKFGSFLDAELVLQEATAKAAARIKTFDYDKGTLGGWFWTIAANTARNMLRSENRNPHQSIEHDPMVEIRLPACVEEDEDPKKQKMYRDLHAVIEELPELQKQVILADLASGEESADALLLAKRFCSSRAAIYNARSKAKQALYAIMTKKGYA